MIKVSEPCVGKEEVEAVTKVLLSGRYVSGPKVEEFEKEFARYLGVNYASAVNSGTAALHISLATIGVGPGDEVIVPSMTFFSTVTSVIHQNAVPIFADIDDTFCIDVDSVEKNISENTKAIIPVHLFGHPCNMRDLCKLSNDYSIPLIEDCAQAHGAEYNGKKVGGFGKTGCFSFYATKNMTTGEGGMIVTDDSKVNKISKQIRNHGMIDRDTHFCLGYNYRMSEINAAIGIVQLKKLDILNQIRIKNSEYLLKNLKKIRWIKIPKIRDNIKHAYFWCPIIIDEKELGMTTKELVIALRQRGLEVRHRYRSPLYKQEMLINKNAYPKKCPFNCPFYNKKVDYNSLYMPKAESLAGRVIGLPNHPKLSKEDLDNIIEIMEGI